MKAITPQELTQRKTPTRKCSKCKQEKTVDQFPDPWRVCKKCKNEYAFIARNRRKALAKIGRLTIIE